MYLDTGTSHLHWNVTPIDVYISIKTIYSFYQILLEMLHFQQLENIVMIWANLRVERDCINFIFSQRNFYRFHNSCETSASFRESLAAVYVAA